MRTYEDWRQRWPRVVVDCQTDAAVTALENYYASFEDGRPRYTGARFEGIAGLNEDPYALGAADLVAVSTLSVYVPREAVVRLLHHETAAAITKLLKQIPPECDIVEAKHDILTSDSAAGRLWELLRVGRDGVGRTTTSKLMAAKRPRLIPIWDSFVEQATGLDTRDYWRKFQTILTADDNRIWNWLAGLRSHVPQIPAAVSTLRLLDVVLWMSVESGTAPTSV